MSPLNATRASSAQWRYDIVWCALGRKTDHDSGYAGVFGVLFLRKDTILTLMTLQTLILASTSFLDNSIGSHIVAISLPCFSQIVPLVSVGPNMEYDVPYNNVFSLIAL